MKKLTISELRSNESITLGREQMKMVKGGIEVVIKCVKVWSKSIGGVRLTRWSCNNNEGDFYALSQMDHGLWVEKKRLSLNGFEM